MRFIHIADLHLGKKLKEFSLIDDQRAVLCQVTEAVKKHKPDAVFIAGDVYDRMIPPAEAVALFDEFLSSLAELDVQVFVISGNHDSPERLAFGSALMDRSGVHISPVYDGTLAKHTVTDEFGEVDVYMLPFVRPATVRHFFEDIKIENYTDAVRAAIGAADIDFENSTLRVNKNYPVAPGNLRSKGNRYGGLAHPALLQGHCDNLHQNTSGTC